MAIQILPQNPTSFGESFGSGLGQGLQYLAQQKMQQVQQRHQQNETAKGLKSLFPDLHHNEIQQIASLPSDVLNTIVKQKVQEPGNQAYMQALQGILGGTPEQGQMSQQPPQQQHFNQPQTRSPEDQALLQKLGISNEQLGIQSPKAPELTVPAITGGINQQQATKLAELGLRKQALTSKEKTEQRKLDHAQEKEISAETLPVYKEITKEAKAAKDNDKRLARMETLIQKGNLSDPLFASAIDSISHGIFGFGIDLTSLQNADSQEFKKLSKDFVKNAKDIFGARLTDTDLKTFLETVPTLSQSDEGKRRVINNLKSFNEATKIRKNVMDDIVAENKGIRPRNLETEIDKRAGPLLDQLAKNFSAPDKEQDGFWSYWNKIQNYLG